jgi:predicted molibdopterin-dependent oxidoreductase YjgC
MTRRITGNVERGEAVVLTIDGRTVSAYAGETLATVLLAEGVTAFHRTRSGQPRAPYCNMGTCFECQVRVSVGGSDEIRWRRACMCRVANGMTVVTGARLSRPESADGD